MTYPYRPADVGVPPASVGAEMRSGAVAAASVVMLGAPLGLLWAAVAPKVIVEATGQGLALASSETKAFVGADAWFLVLTILIGAGCGALAWWLGRRPQLGTALGLLAGSVLAAVVAWRVGHLVDAPRLADALRGLPGKPVVDPTLDLRAKGVLLAWPVSAAAVYTALLAMAPAR